MNGLGKKNGCHTGNPVVFEVDGITVHGGGTSRNGGWQLMDVMPDLAIGPRQVLSPAVSTKVPDGFSCASHVGGDTPLIISIDWPDFGIPTDVGREFWLALVEDIKRLGIKTISTQCVGGHGRTGVQLAILAHMLGAIEKPDAYSLIKWVQSQYCSHAVETSGQQKYVAEMCELPVGEELFVSKKKKSNFQFNDDPIPDSYWKKGKKGKGKKSKGKPKDILGSSPRVNENVDLDGMPTNMHFYACNDCEFTEWNHVEDKVIDECSVCCSKDIQVAQDALFDMIGVCAKCDNTVSYFGMSGDVCKTCEAEEKGATVETGGNIMCKGCKSYVIPEFYDLKKSKCYGCIRSDMKRKEYRENTKKSKSKKSKSKAVGKSKYDKYQKNNLDEWI